MKASIILITTALAVYLLYGEGPSQAVDDPVQLVEVSGMFCEGCSDLVAERLRSVPGITSADVDHLTGEALLGAAAPVQKKLLEQALEGTGYHVINR